MDGCVYTRVDEIAAYACSPEWVIDAVDAGDVCGERVSAQLSVLAFIVMKRRRKEFVHVGSVFFGYLGWGLD